jgi:putative ABC transport system permease protein
MLLENIRQAFGSIRSNLLRTALTMLIIAFGITAMVGVLTSIDGIKYWMRSSFSTLGANTFIIQSEVSPLRIGGRRERVVFRPISFHEAQAFKAQAEGDYLVNIRGSFSNTANARHRGRTTENNVIVRGTDENFLQVEAFALASGRAITAADVLENRKVCVIGHKIRNELFPNGQDPLGLTLNLGHHQYTVVGVMQEKGTAFGSPGDRIVAIPVSTGLNIYGGSDHELSIQVFVPRTEMMPIAIANAEAAFRITRRVPVGQPSNFGIVVSDSFVSTLMENLALLTVSATVISLITLFGASIGLMNIMLVSVTERTREIGVRKSLGATQRQVQWQFLTEAVTITQLGGLLGILLGVGIGSLVGVGIGAPFFIPWDWVVLGVCVCLVVGVVAGWYPARKAARLDPIEALRYE